MISNILVSVIIPIYNVEKYLEKCILSVINQKHKKIEIILVNDGSNDNSLDICNKYKEKDNRIILINQENKGLSAARNSGINVAKGEYIVFIDSDDYVHEDYIHIMLENAEKNKKDIVACDFNYVDENGVISERIKKNNAYFSNIEAIKDIFSGNQITEIMSWNKLYKLSLFNDNCIRFPDGKINEDNFTTYKLYYYSNGVSFVNNKLYYYLQRNNSIMNSTFNIKRLDILEAVEETKNFFEDKELNIKEDIKYYEIKTKINILNIMIKSDFDSKEITKLIEDIVSNRKEYFKNKYINNKIKIILILLLKKGKLYCFALKKYSKVRRKK